jgi:hypothetical protein
MLGLLECAGAIGAAFTVTVTGLDVTAGYKYRLQQHHNFPHLQQLNLSM